MRTSRAPATGSRRALGAVAAAVVSLVSVFGAAGAGASASQDEDGSEEAATFSIEAEPRWGPVPPGAWTPYQVTIRNESLDDFEGDVVLAPARPSAKAGERAGPGPDPLRVGVAVLGAPPAWPTYRARATLAAGDEKTLTIVVLEAPYGYAAELRDRAGKTVAEKAADFDLPLNRNRLAVAVLGRTTGDILSTGAPGHPELSEHLGTTQLNVIRLESGRDFPDDPLLLAGLQAVLLADFDTASMRPTQIKALQAFVGLGGSLILTGGSTAERRVQPLPDDLVPLEPSGTATASLAPLGRGSPAAGASTTVSTGELQHGRAVVSAPEGPALVVEADYGSGHVVQLTYDPFTEPFTSDVALAASGLEFGMTPALDRLWRSRIGPAPEDLWARAASRPARTAPGSAWPGWSMGVLGVYIVLLGPLSYLLVRRRRRRGLGWVAIPACGFVLAGITGLASPGGGEDLPALVHDVVEAHTLGPDGNALVNTYHVWVEPGRPSDDRITLQVAPGAAASGVIAQPAPDGETPAGSTVGFLEPAGVQREGIDRLTSPNQVAARAGPPPEVVIQADGATALTTGDVKPGEARTMQTISIQPTRQDIEASLHLAGSARTGGWRLSGSVTNNTGTRIRSLMIAVSGQFAPVPAARRFDLGPRAEFRLEGVIEPGATVRIDRALTVLTVEELKKPRPTSDERVLSAAIQAVGPRSNQAVVAAFADPGRPDTGDVPNGTRLKVVLKAVTMEGAE